MSTRHIRKLFGTTTLPPLEGNSDEEFEPFKSKGTSSFTFMGLEVSSNSNSEDNDVPSGEEEFADDEVIVKKKKKKSKRNKRQQKLKTAPVIPDGVELDEIDRSVLEVNALLGGPPPPLSPSRSVVKQPDLAKKLLSVQSKWLDYHNEIKKIFGTENPDDEEGKAKKYRPHNVTKYKRSMIVQMHENYHFRRNGLSMVLLRKENGCSYFAFEHNREYQKIHRTFLDMINPPTEIQIEERMSVHVESLLHSTDYLFRAEEYTAANKILEHTISYLQYVSHTYFNMSDQNVRLEYKYAENRPFFVAVLRYLHMLTNRACHRTALELAKLLLNLDPTDPLAIIYFIDVIALRAREHQWLVDVIDYWSKERDANYLFNMKYSYAMAHFHVIKKSKSGDFTKADELLKEAMLAFPTITAQILETARNNTGIRNHPLFCNPFEEKYKTPENVKVAMTMYAKLVCSKWREPEVMQWFLRNANELMNQYDTDPSVKIKLEELVIQRANLYAACPLQIQRHLSIISPMGNLLVDWDLPDSIRRSRAWDPLPPPDGVNRYQYASVDFSTLAVMYPFLRPLALLLERPDNHEIVVDEPADPERPVNPEGPAQGREPPAERMESPNDDSLEESASDIEEQAAAELFAELAAMRVEFAETFGTAYDEEVDREWDINYEDE